MADNVITLESGQKLDTESLAVGANPLVHRERNQLAGTTAAAIADVVNSDPDASDYALAVRPVNVVSPNCDVRTAVALAAGASADLDAATIDNLKTGKLMAVMLASSAACKWVIKARDAAVETSIGIAYTSGVHGGRPTFDWMPPDKRFNTLAGAGVDENFRVTVTNLDSRNAADATATFFWDEVS